MSDNKNNVVQSDVLTNPNKSIVKNMTKDSQTLRKMIFEINKTPRTSKFNPGSDADIVLNHAYQTMVKIYEYTIVGSQKEIQFCNLLNELDQYFVNIISSINLKLNENDEKNNIYIESITNILKCISEIKQYALENYKFLNGPVLNEIINFINIYTTDGVDKNIYIDDSSVNIKEYVDKSNNHLNEKLDKILEIISK